MTPEIVLVKSSAARMSALAGLIVGIVKYLCLKKDRVAHSCVTSVGDIDLRGTDNDPKHCQRKNHWQCGEPTILILLEQDVLQPCIRVVRMGWRYNHAVSTNMHTRILWASFEMVVTC
jgi:hypothetical protein